MRKILLLFISALMIAGASSASAEILLQDNFNGGSFNTASWHLVREGNNDTTSPPDVMLLPVGGNDWAVRLGGNDGDYDDGLRSVLAFPRGNNLRVTFRVWVGGNVNGTNDPFLFTGIQGPWSQVNSFPSSTGGGPYSSLRYLEAGFGRNQSPAAQDFSWHENLGNNFATTPLVETSFTQTLAAATTKSTSMMIRVWLGDSTGARAEWSGDNGTSWNLLHVMEGANRVPVDTIGLTAGNAGPGGTSVSSQASNYVFFSSEFGYTFIDDLVVENDIVPTPLPYRAIFEDDFNYALSQNAVEEGNWRFVRNGNYDTTTSPDAVLSLIAPGDRAIRLGGTDGDYDDGILSARSFDRGNSLRVTFKMWKTGDVFDIGNDWVFHGWNGPWSNTETFIDGTAGGPYDSLNHIEAGISRYGANENGNTKLQWMEGGAGTLAQMSAGPAVDTAFADALLAATDKSQAVTFRVYLGDTTGAFAEWSTDNGQTFTPLKMIDGTVIDTRGLTAGSSAFYPANGAVVSANPTNWIFFHSEFGITWVDDLVVEDQSEGPPPGPTAAQSWTFFE